MSRQPDLFGFQGIGGLSQADDIVTAAQERALIDWIDEIELEPFGKAPTWSAG